MREEGRPMHDMAHALLLVGVMAGVTVLLRFLPFLVFARSTPKFVLYLGEVLPYAIMAMLVVYCLKGISFARAPYGAPELLAVAATAGLHKWKHNTLLSIVVGTVLYMALLRLL